MANIPFDYGACFFGEQTGGEHFLVGWGSLKFPIILLMAEILHHLGCMKAL